MEIQVELAYEFHKFIKIQCSLVLWRALCERVFEVFLIISQVWKLGASAVTTSQLR